MDSEKLRGPISAPFPAKEAVALRVDEAAADRVANELDAVAHPELSHRVGAMVLHGLFGQVEDLGDLLVRVRLGDELYDLFLAGRELVGAPDALAEHVLDQRALGLRSQERLATLHRTDGLEQIDI